MSFLDTMGDLGVRDVTIIHAEGTDDERRTTARAHIQSRKGYFELDTPVYEGDVLDLGDDPRGGPDRRLVAEVDVNDATGHLADMAHIAVTFGKVAPPRIAPVRRLTFEALHAEVKAAAGDLFADGHPRAAVAEAFKSIEVRVRAITGIAGKSGAALMGDAFKAQDPIIDVATNVGQSRQDEREGFLALFRGSMIGIRNPNAHELFTPSDAGEALEYLALASLLHRRIDRAAVKDAG